ncbi:hypothetical protein A2U01_0032614, partial [Trifolium medium]|nr:hypothetical protein [Trifolium medium]
MEEVEAMEQKLREFTYYVPDDPDSTVQKLGAWTIK